MTPDRNSYADIWEMLDGKYAERVRVTDAALVGDEEIVRRWPEISPGYLSRCMTALKLFTDSKNSKAQSWVENPVCGRETFPGIYRVVTVDVDVQKPGLKGIIQTLRRGWAQTPVWSEARLLEEEAGPANDVADSGAVPASDNPTRFLKIKFPNCDPGKVEAIASSLGGVSTYSNVVIRGESYSGTWNTVWVATKLEDDGSGTVTLYLALGQYNIKSYDNFGTEREQDVFYVYDCPKNEAQTIIDAWKAKYRVGSSATTNYSRSNGLVDLVLRRKTETDFEADFGTTGLDCRYTETQTAIFGTRDEDAYPIPHVTNDAGVSYTRTARSNGDGTFDIILTKREVRYRDITGLVVEQTGESKTVQRQQLGLTDEEVEPMEEKPGAIKTQRVEVRDDCSRDVTTNTETGKEQVTTEKTVARSYEEETVETTYQKYKLPLPTQETGKIKTVRNTPSKYVGRWNVLERIRRILHIPSAVVYDSRDDAAAHEQVEESIGVPNAGGVSVVLSAAAGTALRANVRYDKESDTLDVSQTTIEAKEQITTEITEARSYRETVTQKTAQAAPLVDPTAETGKIKTVRNEASDFTGLYDTTERIREIKSIDEAVEYDHADDASVHGRTVERIGQPNSGVSVVLAAGAGESLSASVRYDKETDTLDVVEQTVTAKPTFGETASDGNLETSEGTIERNADATAIAPSAAAGQVVEFSQEPTRFPDKYNVRTEVKTGVPHTNTVISENNLETVEQTRKQSVPNETVSSPASGEIVESSKQASRYKDRFDIDITKRTGKPTTDVTESENNLETSKTIRKRTVDTENAPVAGDGEMVEFSREASRYKDKFDVAIQKKTGVPHEVAWEITNNLETVKEDRKITADDETAPIPGPGEVVDFRKEPSRYKGKFDIAATTRVGIEKTLEWTIGNEKETTVVTDKTTVADESPPMVANGQAIEFQKSPSRYKDKFDIRKVVKTGQPVTIGPFIEDYDGSNRNTKRTIKLNVPVAQIPVASQKGQKVRVSPTQYKGLVDVEETAVTITPWYFDVDEPTTTGRDPSFNRYVFWLADSASIQSYVDAFLAKIRSQTNQQYRIRATVSRDENGYYNLNLSANSEKSGGSAEEWNNGIDFDIPTCKPRSAYKNARAKITMTNSAIKVRAILDAAKNSGNLIEHGAGQTTGVYWMGRGRYKVVTCFGEA